MDLSTFDFSLPDSCIALTPKIPAHDSSLLKVDSLDLSISRFYEITGFINDNDILLFNNTKVLPVRLDGRDIKNRLFEITLNKQSGLQPNLWTSFIKNSKKLDIGDIVFFNDDFNAKIVSKDTTNGLVEVLFNVNHENFYDELHKNGKMPLPPYISKKRAITHQDNINYQTVFASKDGAIAAPTAGLHFTNELMQSLDERNINIHYITLHVGAGTFLPVKDNNIHNHKMHSEYYEITDEVAEQINQTKAKGGRVIAVGTTVLRALESCTTVDGKVQAYHGDTDIFITPGYDFKIVDCLVTNFHLPKSTLFMLICAFSGINRMRNAYQYAIDQNLRFYSFGDACFLTRSHNAINE